MCVSLLPEQCWFAFGLNREFWVMAKAENCYLLSEEKRTYGIGRALTDGKGKGFGQSDVWYADSIYAKENIVPNVVEYLGENRIWRINHNEVMPLVFIGGDCIRLWRFQI